MASYPVRDLGVVGKIEAKRLSDANLGMSKDLVHLRHDAELRRQASRITGVAEPRLRELSTKADLMRVAGIGPSYSRLLEATGVDSVGELRRRKAESLARALEQANASIRIIRRAPSTSRVASWIEEAKTIESAPRVEVPSILRMFSDQYRKLSA